jgi:hypothetical protein
MTTLSEVEYPVSPPGFDSRRIASNGTTLHVRIGDTGRDDRARHRLSRTVTRLPALLQEDVPAPGA